MDPILSLASISTLKREINYGGKTEKEYSPLYQSFDSMVPILLITGDIDIFYEEGEELVKILESKKSLN